ncbi:MAG TPA: glycosyltransferase [Mycobacteriales bacterium]
MQSALTVLMNAGPWLPVPPPDYGGIENVVATLVPELRARGHRVILATVGESDLAADEHLAVFERGQFGSITGPYNEMMGIAHAHMRAVLDRLGRGDVDIVHDHLEVVGPALYAAAGEAVPPVLQTLHWDLAKHPEFYGGFDGRGRVFFAGVSRSQLARAQPALRAQALGAVPLATPLPAGEPVEPAGHLLTLGRFTEVKGYDLAARAARSLGLRLVMAGPVAGYAGPDELARALADPAGRAAQLGDVRYFRREVEPHIDGTTVSWVGSVGGAAKEELVRTARAVLFPLRWEEPGGTAVVEALSAGVPVVAMRRGVLGELIEHGVTGWLADDEDEFVGYLSRIGELDRQACRDVAVRRFSPAAMAARYEALYRRVLALAARPYGVARTHGVNGVHNGATGQGAASHSGRAG